LHPEGILGSQNTITIQVNFSPPSVLALSLKLEGRGENMTNKTFIDNAAKVAKDAVKTAKTSANQASEKIKASTERSKAAIHEVKAEVSDDPMTKLNENLKAGVGKVKAAVHDARAKTKMK
jgi:hypothetical protein